jgi:signal transduction histidine kinase
MVDSRSTAKPVVSVGPRDRVDGVERHVIEMLVHDLQNPLAGIMAFLEILKERPGGLSLTEHQGLSAAQARCQELSELVVTLLQLGQADAFAPVAERGNQALRFEVGDSAPTITSTDERIVRRILYNLTRNALRHTPAGTTVELAVETEPSLQIVVEDDGPGIPWEIQDRVFEPGALRRAGVPSDSGVGLAFCRRAAESLGMRLRFEDGRNKGCRFVLAARDPSLDEATARRASSTREQTARGVSA